MTHLSFNQTKSTFALLSELGIEWRPESDFCLNEQGLQKVEWTKYTPPYPDNLIVPALSALDLLELIRVVFGEVEYENDSLDIEMEEYIPNIDTDNIYEAAEKYTPKTLAQALTAKFFLPQGDGKQVLPARVEGDLEGCWGEFLEEAGKLKEI